MMWLGWVVALVAVGVAGYLWRRVQAVESAHAALIQRTRAAITDAEASARRVREEAERARPFAAEPVLKDLLELVDNLDRALAAGEGGEGVAMIHRQSLDLLRRHGAERFDSVEQAFDPLTHEAIATTPGAPDKVVAEVSAGYRLHGRLLRAARVIVGVPEDDKAG